MPQSVPVTLTENAAFGLFCIQKYRFLTIHQFARIACLHRSTAVSKLRLFEEQGFLRHFGNTGVRGYGKTPKAYFLTRKGWELLSSESAIPLEVLGGYKEVKVEAVWSPQMYHRLRTVDLLIALESAVLQRPHLAIVKTFLEYRRIKRGERIVQETTDYVDAEESAENKIIPDAAYILENRESKRRALFFVEMDMGSERITSSYTSANQTVLHQKFSQYDRYLKSFRYTKTYSEYGEFRAFTLLFVTLQETRIENIRGELQDLPEDLSAYYRLTTFNEAMGDFLSAIWKSRSLMDTTVYPLVREESVVSG
jgi:Replication-relaxation